MSSNSTMMVEITERKGERKKERTGERKEVASDFLQNDILL